MLTRNIGHGLYNGMCGTVKELKRNCAPVIHFGGCLITIPKVDFEILDPENHTPIATRKQYPVLLAYALTVHRAQGQTLPYVYIDCYSFFPLDSLVLPFDDALHLVVLELPILIDKQHV